MLRWGIVLLLVMGSVAQASRHRSHSSAHATKEAQPAVAEAPAADGARQAGWWPPAAKVGPVKVDLTGQATVDLSGRYVFVPTAEAKVLMQKLGNQPGENLVGLIVPKDIEGDKFFVVVRWDKEGYIKDNDADKLDPKALLEAIREGTAEANEFRKKNGFPAVEVVGWDEAPRYERTVHHLVWAIRGRSDKGESVNFNTRLLGRQGYLSMNLICGPEQLLTLKPAMADLLQHTTFQAGKGYGDYQNGKDKVAEYGIAALVLGGAAVAGKVALKVGLLAKFGKVLLAVVLVLKKAIILVILAIGAFFKRLFGGKKKEEAPPPGPPQGPPAAG